MRTDGMAIPLNEQTQKLSRQNSILSRNNTLFSSYEDPFDHKRSPEEERLVRKIDRHILPFICLVDFLHFLDKSAINLVSGMGITEDLKLTGLQFNIAAAIFYVGHLFYQFPNNYCLQYFSIRKYMGIVLIIWGAILASTAASTNFAQLTALRFLLGMAEGGVYPCLLLLVSTMYRRAEQVIRLGLFWLCNGVALAIGGVISYGISHMDSVANLQSWSWCMLLFGLATSLVGILWLLFMIDDPRSMRWHLNAEEQILVEERIQDSGVVRTTHVDYAQVREALWESRLWCFCAVSFCTQLLNGILTNYSVTIVEAFGFDDFDALLLQIPSGIMDVCYILVAAQTVLHTKQTIYVGCACMCVSTVGLILMEFIPIKRVKILGLFLSWSYTAAYVMLLVSVSHNVSGYTKKIFYNGMIMVFYTAGNLLGPFLIFFPSSTPSGGAFGFMAYVIAMVIAIVLFLIPRKKMAKLNQVRLGNRVHDLTVVEDDLTDVQDCNFIYRL